MQPKTWLAGLVVAATLAVPVYAAAQQAGGTLRAYHRGNPPSGSIHEEATYDTTRPYMGVFNNLVEFDQTKDVESLDTVVADLATSWSWDSSKTKLTFQLQKGVKWHDGKPFTAKDVQCTWDLLQGKGKAKLRKNPRKIWYWNLKDTTADNDHQVTFHLNQPQPSFLSLLASGYSPVYPCHVAPATMRTNPIGTGPFKFVELKQNESIKFVKNPDYWKKGKPYLDGQEFTIVKSRSTRVLGFVADKFDMTHPNDITIPLLKDVKEQNPAAVCYTYPTNISYNIIVNREQAPFDNADVRLAMSYAMDRDAFIKILMNGEGAKGGVMLPPPNGVWGMPPDVLAKTPGYGDKAADIKKGQELMKKAGFGPDNRLSAVVSTRNVATYRDPAVILIDQLKAIYIDAELKTIENSNWHATVAKKDYQIGMNLTGLAVDDPDVALFENYACGSQRNYTGYCNKDLQALFEKQSSMSDVEARKKLVWEIDAKLQADVARPMIAHYNAATCLQPRVQGFVRKRNGSYSDWRMENVWLKQ
ncbi:MAG: ABC transporter substrate-binding protein [Rhodospirillales bacterium]